MNKDEALRLALEVIELARATHEVMLLSDPPQKAWKYHNVDWKLLHAVTVIKQALAQEKALQALHNENERLGLYKNAYGQPEPEPVAWMDADGDLYKKLPSDDWHPPHTPLYTSPPKREPLTDEEIDALPFPPSGTATLRDFVRIIEAAHQIKE